MSEAEREDGRSGHIIDRPRLVRTLDGAHSASMVLVTAPAGYGKTLLLDSWTSGMSDTPPARMSLDARDNEMGRFWQTAVARFDDLIPDIGDEVRQRGQLVTPASIEFLVEALGSAFAQEDHRVVMILDDFHLIDDSAVLDSLDLFRDVCPNVQLVLAGRHDPRLPVSRLRLNGQLVEIREADLRFTVDETRELIDESGIDLPDESIHRLWERIEGWPAATRLATLFLANADDAVEAIEQFHGTSRQMADYLLEQVMADLGPQFIDFLYATCIVDEVSGDLADALSGRRDGATILARWERRGLFTVGVPGSPGWFRYHSLLRDLLRADVRFLHPERVDGLHGTAADWHREHGDGATAVHHALEAGRIDDAIAWLGESSPRLVASGQAGVAAELAKRALELSDEESVLLLTTRMMALYYLGSEPSELDDLMMYLASLVAGLPESETEDYLHGGTPSSYVTRSSLPWLQGLLRRSYGDEDGLLELNRAGILPSPTGRVEAWVAEALMWGERYSEADSMVDTYLEHGSLDQFSPSLVHGLGLKSMALVGSGQLGAARIAATRSLALAEEHGIGLQSATWYSRLMLAKIHWMATELSDAESMAIDLQRLAEAADDVPVAVQCAMIRSRVRWSLGDPAGAIDLLQSVPVTLNRRVSAHFTNRLRLAAARLDLLGDDPESAERRLGDWRRQIEDVPPTMREWLLLMRLLVMTDSDPTPALTSPPSPLEPSPLDRLELIRIRAHVAEKGGRHTEAGDMLASGLATAARVGAIQGFADDRSFSGRALGAASRKTNIAISGVDDSSPLPSPRTVYVEPLTRREMAVLEKMQTHLTYPEIADELFVSTNTIKSHAKAIFRKLAVSHRSDAITHARAYGILE